MKAPEYHFNKIFYLLQVLIIIISLSCQNKKDCSDFMNETYLDEQIDPGEMQKLLAERDTLLRRFDVKPIKGQNQAIYHLLYYSSHGFGQSIKFEKKDSSYFLTSKCLVKTGWPSECENFHMEITKSAWDDFEKMIYEFNFWTENQLEANRNVLDGFVFILEGVRPEAEKCGKRTYQLIGRGSPQYDKIGELCKCIINYKEQIGFHYQIYKR